MDAYVVVPTCSTSEECSGVSADTFWQVRRNRGHQTHVPSVTVWGQEVMLYGKKLSFYPSNLVPGRAVLNSQFRSPQEVTEDKSFQFTTIPTPGKNIKCVAIFSSTCRLLQSKTLLKALFPILTVTSYLTCIINALHNLLLYVMSQTLAL